MTLGSVSPLVSDEETLSPSMHSAKRDMFRLMSA